mmetsp:Transcript_13846/g.15384  ORF Transcript_13846/g.15384 Transcript_13846/m.15384 type:complete len:89 (+) Transcript_13846:312-578(+)
MDAQRSNYSSNIPKFRNNSTELISEQPCTNSTAHYKTSINNSYSCCLLLATNTNLEIPSLPSTINKKGRKELKGGELYFTIQLLIKLK